MFNGRSPASRTPSSRPYLSVLVVIAVFYISKLYYPLSWSFTTSARFISNKIYLLLAASLRLVTFGRFYSSKLLFGVTRSITLTTVLEIFISPVKLELETVVGTFVEFFSKKVYFLLSVVRLLVAVFYTGKIKLKLVGLFWWGIMEQLVGVVKKTCNISGRLRK